MAHSSAGPGVVAGVVVSVVVVLLAVVVGASVVLLVTGVVVRSPSQSTSSAESQISNTGLKSSVGAH